MPDSLSPCTGVCRIDPANGCCEGCQRTLSEIAGWASLSSCEKRHVLGKLSQRRLRTTQSR